MSFDALDVPLNQTETIVMDWAKEALELRHGTAGDPKGKLSGWGSTEDSPAEIQDYLLRIVARADRVGELLAKATLAKGRARRAKEAAAFEADLALIKATSVHAGKRVEFSAAREREADAKLDSLEERRKAHHADRLVSVTYDAYEVINQVHWQLDALRVDARTRLRALQFESGLDR